MTDQSIVLMAEIHDTPLDLAPLITLVGDETCGAVASFSGVVRNHDNNTAVNALRYEAHPLAAPHMREVAEAVAARHPGVRIAVVHRTGDLAIGDLAIVAAVASAHRAEAFAALTELVEDVKHQVPIWKHQQFSDGRTEWVGSPASSTTPSSA